VHDVIVCIKLYKLNTVEKDMFFFIFLKLHMSRDEFCVVENSEINSWNAMKMKLQNEY